MSSILSLNPSGFINHKNITVPKQRSNALWGVYLSFVEKRWPPRNIFHMFSFFREHLLFFVGLKAPQQNEIFVISTLMRFPLRKINCIFSETKQNSNRKGRKEVPRKEAGIASFNKRFKRNLKIFFSFDRNCVLSNKIKIKICSASDRYFMTSINTLKKQVQTLSASVLLRLSVS